MTTVTVSYDELMEACIRKFTRIGVPESHARITSDVLVHANLRGANSHGIIRLEHYLNKIAAGGINPNPNIQIKHTGEAVAIVDGDDGLGHVVAKQAMDQAISLSREKGIGAVGVINSSHCGALSYFVKQAADANMIGIAMVNTDKLVVPFGGSEPFFGTNPIAFGFPTGQAEPIIIDMATSKVAYGKILYARENNKQIPPDWAVDSEGRPTVNPDEAVSLLPFGEAKGYGLALAIDIFAGILTGSAYGPHVAAMYGDYAQKRKLGHFFIAVDITRFTQIGLFKATMDKLVEELQAVRPAPGFARVMVPGEPESNLARDRRQKGIPLSQAEYSGLFEPE